MDYSYSHSVENIIMTNRDLEERHSFKVAAFVLLLRNNETFLLRRSNTGWADGMWTIPSGHVEKGESVIEAAIKEANEEAGVVIKPEDLTFVHAHAVEDAYINFYFTATKWEGEAYLAEPLKCSEVAWVSLDTIPNDTIMQVRSLIKNLPEGKYFSEVINDPEAPC